MSQLAAGKVLKLLLVSTSFLGRSLPLLSLTLAKKSLPLDLAFIGLLQLSALAYGVHTIRSEKPELSVLANDGLHIISHADVQHLGISMEKANASTVKPAIALLDLPPSLAVIEEMANVNMLVESRSLSTRDDLYKFVATDEPCRYLQATFLSSMKIEIVS